MSDRGETFPYQVLVDDNFHYMDEEERYVAGAYDSLAAAVVACQLIVDAFLQSELKPGMTADELYEQYRAFGPDPFIRCNDPSHRFSAWTYAKQRCQELCRMAD